VTPREIIEKKRNGNVLTDREIAFFIRKFTEGEIADYHAAALLMAIYIRGMNADETLSLTREMRDSGSVLDLKGVPGKKVDKHSTGGVGDKTSLLLAPIAAACGVCVPMITGRALGHTGGTVDKLESISGFDPRPTPKRVVSQLARHGAVLMGQTDDLAPADARLYALRDATGTVASIPLITSSILSKKLAEGIDGLVLDVKTGSGAFMPTHRLSVELARSLVKTCRRLGTRAVVVLTRMDQPLGHAVGNAIEVRECVDFLNGNAPGDLQTVTYTLAAQMILLAGRTKMVAAAMHLAREAVSSGAAKRKFMDIIAAQGGDVRMIENPALLPKARHMSQLKASASGVVIGVEARLIGNGCNELGAGRVRPEDAIDPAVGVFLHKKVGDRVARGEPLCDIHWNDKDRLHAAMPFFKQAFDIGERPERRKGVIHSILR
jgi:pyrimidine-nucleoside phosphorylase